MLYLKFLKRNVLSLKEKCIDSLNRSLEAPLKVEECLNPGKIAAKYIFNIHFYKSEKGRGLFATSMIPANEFICEYKTTDVYSSKKRRSEREKEYSVNDEGVRVIEAKFNSKTYYFDATRRLNQFGVYANHSVTPNAKLHPPLIVRSKLRVCLYSLRDIASGEEITYDYGDRDSDIPWLSGGMFNKYYKCYDNFF